MGGFTLPQEPSRGFAVGLDRPEAAIDLSEAYGDRAVILCWHTFIGSSSADTDFSLAEFGAQLDAIRALGYRFPRLEDALYGRLTGRLNLIVTIDDGHRTVPAAIEKVLAPRGIEPALFVYPAVIGSTSFSMDDPGLRGYVRKGYHVGAHGYHHLFVTEELKRKDPAAFEREIYKSKEKTESLGETSVLTYAYPFGAFSEVTKEELKRAGFSLAFAVKPGFMYRDWSLNDPYEIPRLVVTRANWPDILAFLARNAQGRALP